MQKSKWVLLASGCLVSLALCAFIVIRHRQAAEPDGGQPVAEVLYLQALSNSVENAYRMNGLPYNYITEDLDGNKKDLKQVVGKGRKMVLRYSELNCSVCIDSAFSYFDRFSKRIGEDNAVLLVEYRSSDYLAQLIRLNHIRLRNVYRIIDREKPLVPEELEASPFLFVLDSCMQMRDVFYPLKELPALSETYYNRMFEKYFK